MYKYLFVFLVSLSFFAFLIPRKEALLRVAGPIIAMAVLMGLMVGLAFEKDSLDVRWINFFAGSMFFFIIGFLDDLGAFRLWWHRLVWQILALSAIIPIAASLRAVSSLPSVLGYIVIPLWFLAVINGFFFLKKKMIVIGTLSLIVFGLLFTLSLSLGNPQLAFASLAPVGALSSFLVYNRFFSRLPLGSCGAMFIGFFIAAIFVML